MSNKKTVLAAAVALVAVAYAGATWYAGQRVQSRYQEGIAELRKLLGEQAVAVDEYHKGFFSSQARLVLQWTPSASTSEQGDAAAAKPLRLVISSGVRHGPLAGARLAAAVIESRFTFEGLDDKGAQALAKATGPTLTAVRHFGGGSDLRLLLPAGEIGDGQTTLRWQELVFESSLSSGGKSVQGTFRWPEVAMLGLPGKSAQDDASEEDAEGQESDAGAQAQESVQSAMAGDAAPVERTDLTIHGMQGRFEGRPIEGLWTMGPGSSSLSMARMSLSQVPAGGGETATLLDLRDLAAHCVIESDSKTLGMTTQVNGAGRIGPIDFDAVGYDEKIQRLDIEALREIQQVFVEGYRAQGLAKAFEALQSQGQDVLMRNAPRLVAALPAYSMKLHATYKGQTGELAYGGEVQSAPTQAQLEASGWMPALVNGTVVHADARLPKAWLEILLKARSGGAEVAPEEVEAMLGMVQSTGYARLEGDYLTSAFKMQGGQITLNGKAMASPLGAMLQ